MVHEGGSDAPRKVPRLIRWAREHISATVSGMADSAFLLKYRGVHNIMISLRFLLSCARVHLHKGAAVSNPVPLHKFCSDHQAEGVNVN